MLKFRHSISIGIGRQVTIMTNKHKAIVEEASIDPKSRTCRGYMAPYVIDPMSRWKVLWDFNLGIIYMLAYFSDPLILAFKFKPL